MKSKEKRRSRGRERLRIQSSAHSRNALGVYEPNLALSKKTEKSGRKKMNVRLLKMPGSRTSKTCSKRT